MPIILYDLAGRDPALRFSPRCWRTRFALAHKGLPVETIPWRFHEAEKLPKPSLGRVPVICDGEQVVHDSWNIAEYLEDAYPDRPSLFAGSGGRAHARFVNEWAETVLAPNILPMIVLDLFQSVDSGDQAYFRETREVRLGKTLEAAQAGREQRLPAFHAMLSPLRATLSVQPWLGGMAPSYADHIAAAAFMWPSCVSRFSLIPSDGPILDWWQRVQLLYGGLAGNASRS